MKENREIFVAPKTGRMKKLAVAKTNSIKFTCGVASVHFRRLAGSACGAL